MIKFFRTIRQKLVSENKISKYLIYAIGEIILVVIGILIALQINNWNEQKKEFKIEKEYMQNMLEDLNDDLAIYEKFQTRNVEIYAFTDSIVHGLKADNRKAHVSQLSYWTRMITLKWMIIHPIERTYEQMKSTGNLRIIKNKKVNDRISNYYNSLKEFDGYNDAGLVWGRDYAESIGKIFDAKVLLNIMRERKMQPAKPNDMLTEDPLILNQLMNSLQYFNGALSQGDAISVKRQKESQELISLIKTNYHLD